MGCSFFFFFCALTCRRCFLRLRFCGQRYQSLYKHWKLFLMRMTYFCSPALYLLQKSHKIFIFVVKLRKPWGKKTSGSISEANLEHSHSSLLCFDDLRTDGNLFFIYYNPGSSFVFPSLMQVGKEKQFLAGEKQIMKKQVKVLVFVFILSRQCIFSCGFLCNIHHKTRVVFRRSVSQIRLKTFQLI